MKTQLLCLLLALVSLVLLPQPGTAEQIVPGEILLEESPLPCPAAEYPAAEYPAAEYPAAEYPATKSLVTPRSMPADCGPLDGQPYAVGPPLPPPIRLSLSPKTLRLVHPPVDVHEFDWIW